MNNTTDIRQPPMGSDEITTPFVEKQNDEKCIENNNKQAYFEKWKVSFQSLLDDEEGSKTFYEYLETEQLGVLFECWYSCEEYRRFPPNKATAKEIYSRFVRIKDTRVPISDQARNNLALRLRANNITEHLLLEIEEEVFGNLRDICYPKFLKSDFFTYYCETNGQVPYEASGFHNKFGKPSTLKRASNLAVVHEQKTHIEESNGLQSSLTPYQKDVRRSPSATKNHPQLNLLSDTANESDRISMAGSRTSCGSDRRYPRGNHNCNHDILPDPTHFRPITHRPNQDKLKQMKPEQFAALLTEKLEKVIQDRTMNRTVENRPDNMNIVHYNNQSNESHSYVQHGAPPTHYSYETDPSEIDTQSWYMPPASDRYSIAGASSHSGSGANVEKYRNIKEKAEKLRNAVHHSLRNDLGECQCQECCERRREQSSYSHSGPYIDEKHNRDCSQNSRYSNSQTNCCCHRDSHHSHSNPSSNRTLNTECENSQLDIGPPVDQSKILAWMAKNEKYKHINDYPEPSPSPAIRRKKQPVIYDSSRIPQDVRPIAQDLGMPLLPQPDTGNVLEEVKRVLEEPTSHRGTLKKHPAPRSHHQHPTNASHYHDQHYNELPYERTGSLVSAGTYSQSDSASLLSYNPSQISTVPSSASRLWNQQGYYESRSDVRADRSEARSHSTGRHSSMHGSAVRSEHRSEHRSNTQRSDVQRSDYQSDVRSQSTGRSHGSSGSKGRSKNLTTVTYYFGVEPIPYRINIPSNEVTLGQFKQETKKGNYRFFFKSISDDDGEVVYEEIKNDQDLLPRYKDKIIGKVEKIE